MTTTVEVLTIAVIAALAGTIAPRVLLRDLPRAPSTRTVPASIPTETGPREIVFDDPAVAPAPWALPVAPRHPLVHSLAGHRPGSAPSPPSVQAATVVPAIRQGVLSRPSDRWTVDLRRVSSARAAVAGMRVQPLGGDGADGQGFEITATDRLGLCDTVGVQPGDVLVAVNGQPTLTADQALDAYARSRGRSSVSFTFRRGARTFTVPMDILGDILGTAE